MECVVGVQARSHTQATQPSKKPLRVDFIGSSLLCMGGTSTNSAKWGTGAEELS